MKVFNFFASVGLCVVSFMSSANAGGGSGMPYMNPFIETALERVGWHRVENMTYLVRGNETLKLMYDMGDNPDLGTFFWKTDLEFLLKELSDAEVSCKEISGSLPAWFCKDEIEHKMFELQLAPNGIIRVRPARSGL